MTTENKQNILRAIDWLIDHFPQTFFKKSLDIKPLQIGIYKEIVTFYDRLETPPFSKKLLKDALNYYSASRPYLLCQKANAARIDLYGNEVDSVTEDQAKYAHQRFEQRYNTPKKASDISSNN